MSLASNADVLSPRNDARTAGNPGAYIVGPVADFLLLGGGSLIVLAGIWLFLPTTATATLATLMLWVANVINHPHFAHSYQIFYRDFRQKAFGDLYSRGLRTRYVVAGIVVPILLAIYLLASIALDMPQILKFGINLMAFFTGWHYVKQGYGILMLDSALKRSFFDAVEKRVFLLNAYVVWALAWISLNLIIEERDLFSLKAYAIPLPDWSLPAVTVFAAISSLAVAFILMRRLARGQSVPWNGVIAYIVSSYIWLIVARGSLLMALVVPAMHSLQYLAVVWRYQLNREKAEETQHASDGKLFGLELPVQPRHVRFGSFLMVGLVLGALGFWVVPFALDLLQPYDPSRFGSLAFMTIFWIFINIHHYFLDNVMWRRENADMKKYLFG